MNESFHKLIRLHLESKEFMDVLNAGSRFLVVHDAGRTMFKVWGSDKKYAFTTFRTIVELTDIVCGVMDKMVIGYTIRHYDETPKRRQIEHFIIQEVNR